MKTIEVTFILNVDSKASVSEVIDQITIDMYGDIQEIVNVTGEVIENEED